MDHRRQITFIALSIGFFFLWVNLAPRLFPDFFPAPGQKPPVRKPAEIDEFERPAVAEQAELPPPTLFDENREILLGAGGFAAKFLVQAQVSSLGAAIDWVQLTDPRYTTLDRSRPLRVVGNELARPLAAGLDRPPRSLELAVEQIDEQLRPHGLSLATVDWELVEPQTDPNAVTFRYPAPDGTLEVLKTYRVAAAEIKRRDSDPAGYLVDCELTIRNLGKEPIATKYTLQGPVGIPLENAENTIVYREVKVGTLVSLSRPDRVTAVNLSALELSKQHDKAQKKNGGKIDTWRAPIHYIGIDDQFFCALLFPRDQATDRDGDGVLDPYFDVCEPVLLHKARKPERSDVSVRMHSLPITLAAGAEMTHRFQLFCGPKRSSVLEPMQAGPVLQYGWFSSVSKVMLWILEFFHTTIGLSYAFSIMALTVCVRVLMMPITKKQLAQAERMKELAPKMKELQEKYKQKPEELGRAMNELYKRHNVHPAAGCLPMLVQLPIFIGLYRSLQYAIDLRLAQFLWIENLAAPDALFQLGFVVPWFEWTEFNLLPILAVVLILVQQKFLMPPPTTDEQVMQYRIINVMMLVMGVFFYRTQAGLMIYILTTTIWGLAERQILKRYIIPAKIDGSASPVELAAGTDAPRLSGGQAGSSTKTSSEEKPASGPRGWFEKLLEAADEARKTTNAPAPPRDPQKRKRPKR